MMFKGKESIGRRNYRAVVKAMAKMDEFINAISAERRSGEVLKKQVLSGWSEELVVPGNEPVDVSESCLELLYLHFDDWGKGGHNSAQETDAT